MKKILSIILVFIFFAACDGSDNEIKTRWTIKAEEPDRFRVYEGENVLTGWIIFQRKYANEVPEAHFHPIDQKFPHYFLNKNFRLTVYSEREQKEIPLPESLLQKLGEYNKKNPAKILVNKITAYSEGSPKMNLVEILE